MSQDEHIDLELRLAEERSGIEAIVQLAHRALEQSNLFDAEMFEQLDALSEALRVMSKSIPRDKIAERFIEQLADGYATFTSCYQMLRSGIISLDEVEAALGK